MTTLFRRPVLVALLALAAVPSAAHASSSAEIHRECQSGKIARDHSAEELTAALRSIPTDLDEYTDCREVIRRAQLGGMSPSTSASEPGAGAGAPPSAASPQVVGTAENLLKAATPAERKAVGDAARRPGAPVEIGSEQLVPVAAATAPAGATNAVPTPLVVTILLLGAGLAFGGLASIRDLIPARRR